jgi:flagellar hook-associated protein 1 FlgK
MSLSQALATAVTGLRATQAGLSVVASNVANADTPGYVRKTPVQVTTAAGQLSVSVRVAAINRELDQYVQRQLRVESAGASYADLRARFYDRLQSVYGVPGSGNALETVFNDVMSALETLSTTPESAAARNAVLSAAEVLTQQLNGMASDIQGLRSDAEMGLDDAVSKANEAMRRIAELNQQLGNASSQDATTAAMLDQRDRAIDELAGLMDIRVVPNDHNRVTIFTNSGIQLVGNAASQLAFDNYGTMTPTSQWSADPSKRNVGTIVLIGPHDANVDLIASRSIRSGQLAALIEMRDQILVEAQSQLDEIAAGLARALSDRTTDGTAVTAGAQSGFDIDLNGLLNGNSVNFTYTDNTTSTQHTVTLVRVDDPAALPLDNTATPDPNDRVIGVNLSGGLASVISQLNGLFATAQLQFSNPAGLTLRVLDDGAMNKVDVNALFATKTVTSLTGGSGELPLFLDGNGAFTGAITAGGKQATGLAGRIALNAGLRADPSRLVVFQTSPLTPAGDSTRPNFLYERLRSGVLSFSPAAGIGTTAAPFRGSLPAFMRQVISSQGDAAAAATHLQEGQQVVFNALQQRFNDSASVNIDEEMANLLHLQNSYAASARVLSTIKEMLDALMRL